MKNIIIDKLSSERDFNPLFSGEEVCLPSHSFGPYVRDCYIIHFCLSGKGTLTNEKGEHKVEAGEMFIIRKGETTTYRADAKNPWHYLWIATLGARSSELGELPSVIKCDEVLLERIKSTVDENETRPEIYCAFLYELIYRAKKSASAEPTDKITKVKSYIKYNYMMHIGVDSISKTFGFERSYLYRLFKKRYGTGVKEYIVKLRMEKAKELLSTGHSVKCAAELVGYCDEFAFSKAYKNYFGAAPKSDRK